MFAVHPGRSVTFVAAPSRYTPAHWHLAPDSPSKRTHVPAPFATHTPVTGTLPVVAHHESSTLSGNGDTMSHPKASVAVM